MGDWMSEKRERIIIPGNIRNRTNLRDLVKVRSDELLLLDELHVRKGIRGQLNRLKRIENFAELGNSQISDYVRQR